MHLVWDQDVAGSNPVYPTNILNMIPKIIHYINFGELSEFRKTVCYNSILEHCKDFQIMYWDETTFDVNMCKWTKRCYENRDYRHLADYIRIWALLKYGGVYIDTDVEVVKPFDDLLQTDKNIVGLEALRYFGVELEQRGNQTIMKIVGENLKRGGVAMGLLVGINPSNSNQILHKVLSKFENTDIISDNVLMEYTNQLFLENGMDKDSNDVQEVEEYLVYPPEYFCPIPWQNKTVNLEPLKLITDNTYVIHHYNCD